MKNSFVFYTDWLEQIETLPLPDRGTLFSAVVRHAAGEDLPAMDEVTGMAFSFIRAQLDRDTARYEEIVEKRRLAGKKRAEQMLAHADGADHNQQKAALEGVTDTVTDTDDVTDDVTVNVSSKEDKREKRKRFVPPTIDDVRSYIREKGFTFDADQFVAYYTSNGWKVGRNNMKDWRAACRTWQQREKPKAAEKVEPRDYDMDDLELRLMAAQGGVGA